ncbi:MAG TPA: hypothetical protein VMZ90_04965 [Vicinamibacterales bacterium]|nr:hypothetical protein [Vicinamibacterales bacterium]
MTTFAAVQWRKELRELLPWWLGTAITMGACWALMHPDAIPFDGLYRWSIFRDRSVLLGAGLCAYAAGAVTLGALSIGQEYSHHTLPQLISHPAARGRLLAMKLVVLAALLGALFALAFTAWGSESALTSDNDAHLKIALGVVPVIAGLLLAPWLTMVGRGPLAGAVFATVLPVVLWMAGTYFELSVAVFAVATMGLALLGAFMTWRTFVRLEVAGDHHQEVDLFGWVSRRDDRERPPSARSPYLALLGKELRLQQLTLVLSGLFVVGWSVAMIGWRFAPGTFGESAIFVLVFLHGALVPLMAGSLASAEERRLRAADWNLLLPLAAWKQWAVKAGVALSLTFLLGVVLPDILNTLVPLRGSRDYWEPMVMVVLCCAALYVSSLTRNALRAMLATPPAIGLTLFTGLAVLDVVLNLLTEPIGWLARILHPFVRLDRQSYYSLWRGVDHWALLGFVPLFVVFAYRNHRTSESSSRSVGGQLGWLMAFGLGTGLLVVLLGRMFALAPRIWP